MSEQRNTARRWSKIRSPEVDAPKSSRVSKVTAAAALGFAIVLGAGACSSGQVSQTANQIPAVNGANVVVGDNLKIRDAQIMYPADMADNVYGGGGPFEVAFVVVNEDQVDADRLVSIEPVQGTVTLEGETVIPPGEALRAGAPVGLLVPTDSPTGDDERRISATLDNTGETVAAGLTTDLVFTFENAGEVTVSTPVDAGARLERQDLPRQAEPPQYDQVDH